jgi:hypothetical protein
VLALALVVAVVEAEALEDADGEALEEAAADADAEDEAFADALASTFVAIWVSWVVNAAAVDRVSLVPLASRVGVAVLLPSICSRSR